MLLAVQIPVAEGAHTTFAGIKKDWVADFVHGDDGFGNMNFAEVQVRRCPYIRCVAIQARTAEMSLG